MGEAHVCALLPPEPCCAVLIIRLVLRRDMQQCQLATNGGMGHRNCRLLLLLHFDHDLLAVRV